jgi:hypothetical protein
MELPIQRKKRCKKRKKERKKRQRMPPIWKKASNMTRRLSWLQVLTIPQAVQGWMDHLGAPSVRRL